MKKLNLSNQFAVLKLRELEIKDKHLIEFLDKIETVEKVLYVNYKDYGIGAYKYNDVIPSRGVVFKKRRPSGRSR